RDNRNTSLFCSAGNIKLPQTGLWRLHKYPVGIIRYTLYCSVNTDHTVDTTIKRFYLFIGYWPFIRHAVLRFKIVRPHAQRTTTPMVRSPAKHTSAKPFKLGVIYRSIGFAI